MTTSFALLVRGDVTNSLRANSVGTLLALFCALVVPWSILCAWRGRLHWIRQLDTSITVVVGILLLLMLIRWGLVIWLGWTI
jgi:hypothetical protein